MKTEFSASQLADPDLARADAVIRSCVRHGFCPQTCPTYALNGDENDSPRGRIDLIRAMLERGGTPDPKTVTHIDRCLSCLGCETTCAARLHYRELIDHARTYIEQHYRRPRAERWLRSLLAQVMPYPGRLRALLALARLAAPLHPLLPETLRHLASFAPTSPSAAKLHGGVFPAEGPRRRRVALLGGCVQQVMGASINDAAIRLLTRHGCEVLLRDAAGCCGGLTAHMGRPDAARAHARGLLAAWRDELESDALDAIVVTASGCGTSIKDYGQLFADDPAWRDTAMAFAARARDLSEVMVELDLQAREDFPQLPIAYHDACSLQHGQRVVRPPRVLLERAGFLVRNVGEGHFCCGSAGTYNLLQPDMARALGQRKAAAIDATGAVALTAGNLGCLVQIARYTTRPAVHLAELLDWASGGPRPEALENLDTSAWPARCASPPAAPVAADAINFWTYTP